MTKRHFEAIYRERVCAIRLPTTCLRQPRVKISLMDSRTVEAENVNIQLVGKGPGHDFCLVELSVSRSLLVGIRWPAELHEDPPVFRSNPRHPADVRTCADGLLD